MVDIKELETKYPKNLDKKPSKTLRFSSVNSADVKKRLIDIINTFYTNALKGSNVQLIPIHYDEINNLKVSFWLDESKEQKVGITLNQQGIRKWGWTFNYSQDMLNGSLNPVWNACAYLKNTGFDYLPITGDSAKELETQLRSHCSKYEKLDELLKSSICK